MLEKPTRNQASDLAARICRWNRSVPVGGEVLVRAINGELLAARTLGPAWLLAGTIPVVLVEGGRGGSGCYSLNRVVRGNK